MGLKGSKHIILSYEDALKRLNDSEICRIKEAFRRLSGSTGVLSKCAFIRDILGENVPCALAEHIFTLYGGTSRGIGWKELVCGLVLLTRGTHEERLLFAFTVFACNNEGNLISREDIERLLIQVEGSASPEILALFNKGNQADYETFRCWVADYPSASSVIKWLLYEPRPISLSGEMDSPTFYQTLAGVTHLEESEILELEKAYLSIERLGRFDLSYFLDLVTIPFPSSHQKLCDRLCDGLFCALDENRDLHIDFKEEVCGISAACRGPLAERLKFAFKVWDKDREGVLRDESLNDMLSTFLVIANFPRELTEEEVIAGVTEMKSSISTNYNINNGFVLEDFLLWSFADSTAQSFVTFISQLFTVYFGLKPPNRREEGEAILSWLRLRKKFPPPNAQLWYLISIEWWKLWLDYVLLEAQSYETLGLQRPTLHHSVSASSLVSYTNTTAAESGDDSKSLVSFKSIDKKLHSKPGPIDNSTLLAPEQPKVTKLTSDGGLLKKGIISEKDFEFVPKELWVCLSSWYGASLTIPRTFRPKPDGRSEIELYPVLLKIHRHNSAPASVPPPSIGMAFSSVVLSGGYGYFGLTGGKPTRYLAYTACFNKSANIGQVMNYLCGRLNLTCDNFRLWHMKEGEEFTLLDQEKATLESLGFQEDNVLLEVRSPDQTWPEEIGSLASGSQTKFIRCEKVKSGTTGLYNLGNTCFMNSALQCVSNTKPLTEYFTERNYMKELNRTNPLGMKGQMALSYGQLVKNLWDGLSKNISPGVLRDTIYKYAPRFGDCQQHDAQELLAFLLDGLHEDLNRITEKPYVELKDSDGRPDEEVATEAWDNHLRRNRSIIVDLFHGQLKSKLTCVACERESVRFDPFTYLSLPLPLDNFIHVEVMYLPVDGEKPIKYGILLGAGSHYRDILEKLTTLAGKQSDQLKLAYVCGSRIQTFPDESDKVMNTPTASILYAFEIIAFTDWPPSPVESPVCFKSIAKSLPEIQRLSRQPSAPAQANDTVSARGTKETKGEIETESEESSSSVKLNDGVNLSKRESREIPDVICSDVELSTMNQLGSTLNLPREASRENQRTAVNRASYSACVEWKGYLTAYHRRLIRQDVYFVSPNNINPSLFGLPLLVPFYPGRSSGQDLFKAVWTLVSRHVSPLPATDGSGTANHALDCDDSLGYEYPFVLKAVAEDGVSCAWCPWWKYCRGCGILCDGQPLFCHKLEEENVVVFDSVKLSGLHIAVEWDPTALHLRYQPSLEKDYIEHSSVSETSRQMNEPVNLKRCLEAFTLEERLRDEERVFCPNCHSHQICCKKLQIWRLPPILIVHLKRFQLIGGRWMKSPKAVHFTLDPLDPSEYLAAVPREAVLNRTASLRKIDHNDNTQTCHTDSEAYLTLPLSDGQDSGFSGSHENIANNGGRRRVVSTSLSTHPPSKWGTIQDFHEHKLIPDHDPLDLSYRLYAAVCHSGIMGGGHYVAYACHDDGKWYCYNDSSCKEVEPTQIDPHDIYMLLYERIGLDGSKYVNPDGVDSGEDSASSSNSTPSGDPDKKSELFSESDKKNCVLM